MKLFLTFEGIEGCGKSTHVELLTEALQKRGLPVLATREPGGTSLGGAIRQLLVTDTGHQIHPMTELFLYNADRAQHVQEVIRPALDSGKIVICDRYLDSTMAYQGYGRELSHHLIHSLGHWATEGLVPEKTLLLDCTVKIGLQRSKARLKKEGSSEDRFEKEELEFHERVRKGFLELALKEPERFKVFNANQKVEVLHQQILEYVNSIL